MHIRKFVAFLVLVVASLGLTLTVTGANDESQGDQLRRIINEIFNPSQSGADVQRTMPRSQAELQYSYAPLVKLASPAVVNVHAGRMVQQRSPFDGDPFFERFFGQRMPGRSRKHTSLGSGVVIDSSGIIVTNNHVIDGADEIKISFANGQEFDSKVLLKDEQVDLAVLKIEDEDAFPTISYGDSDRLEVGDIVLAIGNPFGVGQTVTSGIVSALARNGVGVSDFGFFIQTDAAINPGNSGGALIDMNGRLIGINTAIFSRSGGSNGIGFAIPANMVRAVVESAKAGEDKFVRPYIGASFSHVTSDMAEALGMEQAFGAIVTEVERGAAAHKAGLRAGDLVVSLNGLTVQHPDALGYRLATTGIGNRAELKVVSRSKVKTISIKLAAPRKGQLAKQVRLSGRNPFSGALVARISPQLASELSLRRGAAGVVVLDVLRGSPANRLGLRPRDIFISLNGQAIEDTRDIVSIIEDEPGFWQLEINRDGRRLRQTIR